MGSIDCYQILGIEPTASLEEIKKAYFQLAKQYHPDNQETGDLERFLAVTEAYERLSDFSKKSCQSLSENLADIFQSLSNDLAEIEKIYSVGMGVLKEEIAGIKDDLTRIKEQVDESFQKIDAEIAKKHYS